MVPTRRQPGWHCLLDPNTGVCLCKPRSSFVWDWLFRDLSNSNNQANNEFVHGVCGGPQDNTKESTHSFIHSFIPH